MSIITEGCKKQTTEHVEIIDKLRKQLYLKTNSFFESICEYSKYNKPNIIGNGYSVNDRIPFFTIYYNIIVEFLQNYLDHDLTNKSEYDLFTTILPIFKKEWESIINDKSSKDCFNFIEYIINLSHGEITKDKKLNAKFAFPFKANHANMETYLKCFVTEINEIFLQNNINLNIVNNGKKGILQHLSKKLDRQL